MPVLTRLKGHLASVVLGHLFLQLPEVRLDNVKVQAFDRVFDRICEGSEASLIASDCTYHKSEFLRYLAAHKNVLLHGSNRSGIDTLLPREHTDYAGKPRTAVFASGDGVWPLFFAVLDQTNYRGSLRNGCFVVTDPKGTEERFYFFSLSAALWEQQPWTKGMIYVLPRDPFQKTSTGTVRFDEWACEEPVRPLGWLPVSPADFPLLHRVTPHDEWESVYVSWLRFKKRQKTAYSREQGEEIQSRRAD